MNKRLKFCFTFQLRAYTYPPGVCIKVYEILISHIMRHYNEPNDYSSNTAAAIRHLVTLHHIVLYYNSFTFESFLKRIFGTDNMVAFLV